MGVGDGPWERMDEVREPIPNHHFNNLSNDTTMSTYLLTYLFLSLLEFDDELPERKFDNFQVSPP